MNKCPCNKTVVIIQGDQYGISIPITRVNNKGTEEEERIPITSANVDGVKIKIDKFEESYPNGNLTYNDELERWVFPLTQEMSLKLYGERKAQVQIKQGDIIQSSPWKKIYIDTNIIKEEWASE